MNISSIIKKERQYQQKQLKLIPSENYISEKVMNAVGSVLLNKYAEGQAGKRYYHGNRNIDQIEELCKERALNVFGLTNTGWSVNVQAVTGSIANLAIYSALLEPGDRMLSMFLPDGGHLSHGWKLPDGRPVSFTGKIFDSHFYHVSLETQRFDYDEIDKRAAKVKPKIIISGGTAYPRVINYKRLAEIAHATGALYIADVAHEAGLIAGGAHPSPFEHADIVTMTSRKTLRGPIGSLIFARNPEHADLINRAVFPGLQGGPMINSIAGIAIALEEASQKQFQTYAHQVVKNASSLAEELMKRDFELLTGGTDTHLILIDVRNKQPDGLIAAEILESVDIITNKNTIPDDPKNGNHIPPWRPFGLRIGTPAITTRGMKLKEMKTIAELIDRALTALTFEPDTKASIVQDVCSKSSSLRRVRSEVHKLTALFPIYTDLH